MYSQSIQWNKLIQLFINDSVAELEKWQCYLENEIQTTILAGDHLRNIRVLQNDKEYTK